jgi:MshEN domain
VPFGKYLLKQGILSREQLEEATQAMVVFGGRLGTHLVESGALRIEDLEKHLAEYLAVPRPPPEGLARPDPKALAAVPRHLIESFKIFPFKLEERTLHAAMRDPRNSEQIAELARATRLRIKPYLLAEIRLFFLLEKAFGVRPGERYQRLTTTDERRPAPGPVRVPPPDPEEAEARRHRDTHGIKALGDDEEFLDKSAFSSLYGGWQITHDVEGAARSGAAATPSERKGMPAPPSPAEVVRLEAALAEAKDREDVARHALEIARVHADAAALFTVRGDAVQGLWASGSADGPRVRAALFAAPDVPEAEGALARGTPQGLAADLATAAGRGEVRDAAVLPVRIRGRAVNLLYADNGALPLPETGVAALEALCDCVSQAYERIILARKRRHC